MLCYAFVIPLLCPCYTLVTPFNTRLLHPCYTFVFYYIFVTPLVTHLLNPLLHRYNTHFIHVLYPCHAFVRETKIFTKNDTTKHKNIDVN